MSKHPLDGIYADDNAWEAVLAQVRAKVVHYGRSENERRDNAEWASLNGYPHRYRQHEDLLADRDLVRAKAWQRAADILAKETGS